MVHIDLLRKLEVLYAEACCCSFSFRNVPKFTGLCTSVECHIHILSNCSISWIVTSNIEINRESCIASIAPLSVFTVSFYSLFSFCLRSIVVGRNLGFDFWEFCLK